MSQIQVFKKCNIKTANLEQMLVKNEKTIAADSHQKVTVFEEKLQNFDFKGDDILRLKFAGTDNHAALLIKNSAFKRGLSIFDPNGLFNLKFIIRDKKHDSVTREYAETLVDDSMNYGDLKYNPGYCNVFTLIFIVYYRKIQTEPQFIKKIQKLLKLMVREKHDLKTGPLGVDLSYKVQELVLNYKLKTDTTEIQNLIFDEIHKFIQQHTVKSKTKFTSKPTTYKHITKKTNNKTKRTRSKNKSRSRSRSYTLKSK